MDNKNLFQAWFRKQLGFDVDGDVYAKLLALLGKPKTWPNATYETAVNYWNKQCSNTNVFNQMVKLVVNNESYFFREPFCFCFFQSELGRHFSDSAKSFNVLSIGCSAGQEIYSCAIQAFKMFGNDFGNKVKLFGVDVDDSVLDTARRGVFKDWDMRGLSPAELSTHFVKQGSNSIISPTIRDKVTFFSHNIFDDWPSDRLSQFEFVFCRNLLSYLSPSVRKDCLRRLKDIVRPGGVLVLAAAEIASLHVDGFRQMEHDGYFYLKRSSAGGSLARGTFNKAVPSRSVAAGNSSRSVPPSPLVSREPIKSDPASGSARKIPLSQEKKIHQGLKESATAYTEAVAKMKRAVSTNGALVRNTPPAMKVNSEPQTVSSSENGRGNKSSLKKASPIAKPVRVPSPATYTSDAQGSVGTGVTGDVAVERNIQTCFEKYSNGEIQEALQYCEMCLKRSSTFSPEAEGAFLVIQGLSYKALGNIKAATEVFQRSAFLLPLSWTANYFLGECQSAAEDDEEAAKSFARAYKCLACTKVPLVDVLFLEDLPRDNMKSVCLSRLESLNCQHLVQEH